MDALTQDEIDKIVEVIFDDSDREFCVMLAKYMMGYLRYACDIKNARQDFFKQIKRHLDGKNATLQGNRASKSFRDYEPEQAYGTADDLRKHIQYGGSKEDY